MRYPDISTTLGRQKLQPQKLQRRLRRRLGRTLTRLRTRYGSKMEDDELASFSIRKLSPIDVDETAPFDPDPLFFQPYPLHDKVDFRTALVQGVKETDPYPLEKWF